MGLVFIMKQGDTDPAFRVRLLDDAIPGNEDAKAVDLTTATSATLKVQNPAGTLIINSALTIENQVTAKGWVNRPWVAGETDIVNDNRLEIPVVWSSGKKRTFPAGDYGHLIIIAKLG